MNTLSTILIENFYLNLKFMSSYVEFFLRTQIAFFSIMSSFDAVQKIRQGKFGRASTKRLCALLLNRVVRITGIRARSVASATNVEQYEGIY